MGQTGLFLAIPTAFGESYMIIFGHTWSQLTIMPQLTIDHNRSNWDMLGHTSHSWPYLTYLAILGHTCLI